MSSTMRIAAICLTGCLLMQLPAKASIVAPAFGSEISVGWTIAYRDLTWELATFPGDGFPKHRIACALDVLASADECWQFPLRSSLDLARGPILDDLAMSSGSFSTDLVVLHCLESGQQASHFRDIHTAAGSVCPEPATITIWGVTALALAAATYRRQKRGKVGHHVQVAVKEYLQECDTPGHHFRLLGSYLTKLADDPRWSKQDIDAFYDEVVVALHHRREHAEVA